MNRVITRKFKSFTEEENSLCETLFHNANGYIGVRGAIEENVPSGWDTMRGIYINGVYDVIPMKQAESLCNFVEEKETMLNIADALTVKISIDGETFSLTEGEILSYERILDMDQGITVRKIDWRSPKGKLLKIAITRMTSFEMLPLFSMDIEITPVESESVICVQSEHQADVRNYCNPKDPRLAAESIKNLDVLESGIIEDVSLALSETMVSKIRVCSAVRHITNVQQTGTYTTADGKTVYTVEEKCDADHPLRMLKLCVFTDSRRYEDPKQTALALLKEAEQKGIDYYYQKQKDYLCAFWHKCEMTLDGDEELNNSVNFNMYELLQSVSKDPYANIAAKGMSGEGYEGHYFWDTEMFIMPYFTLTNPQISKMLLSYRYHILPKAQENARLLGHRQGALYPWRTITGVECSGYYPSGTAQYHINSDIAYAIVQYYLITGDAQFMCEQGMEMLVETARLWLDVGNYVDGTFRINDVTGPDEYTCMVNNNYYTNCGAKYNLMWAYKCVGMFPEEAKRLGVTAEEADAMKQAADQMLLLLDEKLGINPQDDSFLAKPVWNLEETPKDKFPLLLHYHPLHLYRYQVCKQADTVLAYFLYEDQQSRETMIRSYEYYEKITTHDSSLSTCIFSIVASRLGLKEKGFRYFGDSAKLDLENTHHNTKDGIHTANMGGCYMSIVFGFAGLRITEQGISLSPFVPEQWDGYSFNICYHGNLFKVTVNQKNVSLLLLEGEPFDIDILGKIYHVTDIQTVTTLV